MAESRVRPMMWMTDTPNDAIKQQMRKEAINFIKLRSAAASKFKKNSQICSPKLSVPSAIFEKSTN